MARSSSILIALLTLCPALGAQAPRAPRFAIAGGLLVADNGASQLLRSRGVTGFLRVSLRARLPAIIDVSFEHVSRNNDVQTAPCPPLPATCGASYTGPTTVLTLAPAIQAAKRVPPGTWLLHLGPSVHWLVDRTPGSDPLAFGARAGVGFRPGQAARGFLISADYIYLFRPGTPPAWFLPITFGWQF